MTTTGKPPPCIAKAEQQMLRVIYARTSAELIKQAPANVEHEAQMTAGREQLG